MTILRFWVQSQPEIVVVVLSLRFERLSAQRIPLCLRFSKVLPWTVQAVQVAAWSKIALHLEVAFLDLQGGIGVSEGPLPVLAEASGLVEDAVVCRFIIVRWTVWLRSHRPISLILQSNPPIYLAGPFEVVQPNTALPFSYLSQLTSASIVTHMRNFK
jgi:hypothetical protein